MRKGKLIVFEGTDGSGKATQLKLLVAFFKKQGLKVAQTDFPQYYTSFFGKLAGRFLAGEFGGNEISPYLSCLTYAGDRFEAREKIKKWLSQRKIVLSNRYTSSSMAHHTAKLPPKERGKFIRFLEKLEYEVFGIPREDIVLFLYVPVEIGQRLVDKKGKRGYVGGKRRDIHEADLDHLRKASEVYLKLVRKYPHWLKINCCDQKGNLMSPEKIHKKILLALRRKKIIR